MNNPNPVAPGKPGARTSGPQGTRLFSGEQLRQQAAASMQESTGHASVREPVLESSGTDQRRFKLRAGRQTIGRSGENDIRIDDPSVSASHAWIMNQQGHYVIMNTLSTNGTFVNGERIHETLLEHGDRIRLGQAEFVFLTREPGTHSPWRAAWIALGVLVLIGLGALLWWQL